MEWDSLSTDHAEQSMMARGSRVGYSADHCNTADDWLFGMKVRDLGRAHVRGTDGYSGIFWGCVAAHAANLPLKLLPGTSRPSVAVDAAPTPAGFPVLSVGGRNGDPSSGTCGCKRRMGHSRERMGFRYRPKVRQVWAKQKRQTSYRGRGWTVALLRESVATLACDGHTNRGGGGRCPSHGWDLGSASAPRLGPEPQAHRIHFVETRRCG
jgi:hypothetical protein